MPVEQYRRKLNIVVATDAGEGLDFEKFRVQFVVRRGDVQTPNTADITIFNLAEHTASQITAKEFTQLSISAGYEGNYGLLFRGQIKQTRKGRVDQKDSYVSIAAADGDEPYNFSSIALTLAAGMEPQDEVQAFLKTMAKGTINQGSVCTLSTHTNLRPRVYYGMTKDEWRDFAERNDVLWSIQDGMLTIIPQAGYILGPVQTISPATGLIGVPEQTQNGIRLRTLLNPRLKIGTAIKLDSTINQYRYGLDTQSLLTNKLLSTSIKANADGLYYIMVADHSGDTRGNEWYTDLTCLAVDATIPPNLVPLAAVNSDAESIPRY